MLYTAAIHSAASSRMLPNCELCAVSGIHINAVYVARTRMPYTLGFSPTVARVEMHNALTSGYVAFISAVRGLLGGALIRQTILI